MSVCQKGSTRKEVDPPIKNGVKPVIEIASWSDIVRKTRNARGFEWEWIRVSYILSLMKEITFVSGMFGPVGINVGHETM